MRELPHIRRGRFHDFAGALAALLLLANCAPVGIGATAPAPSEFPALEAAIASDPGDSDRVVRLAAGYQEADRLQDAAALLERNLERAPGHAGTVLLLGSVYEEQERFADARALYEAKLEGDFSPRLRDEFRSRIQLVRRQELREALRSSLSRERDLADTPPTPNTIAVFPFIYRGADEALEPLGRALADMLATDLSQTNRLQVLERMQVQMLVDEMALGESALTEPETAARSGRLLGAERVVQGALDPRGQDRVALEAAVVRVVGADTTGGRTVTEADELERLFDLEKRLAFDIYSSLGVQLTAAEIERVNQRATQNIQALLAYGIGLEALDAGEYERAADQFRSAAALDPGFAQAQQRAQEAESVGRASTTSTRDLARQALAEGAVEPTVDIAAEALIPSLGTRDPVAEVLGTEGVARPPTILEVIIRRP